MRSIHIHPFITLTYHILLTGYRPSLRYRRMDTADKVHSVPLFSGMKDNFLFWQTRIKALLMERGAHAALVRQVHITQDEKEEANMACSVILRGLGDVPMAAVIRHADNPAAMWTALSERFAGTSTFNKASVQTALAGLRYGGKAMEQYVAEYEHLNAKLESMGSPMDESMLITLFFQSFATQAGSQYAAVIAALQTKETLTWVQASSRMLQEYAATRALQRDGGAQDGGPHDGGPHGDGEQAHFANAKLSCWYCKKKGHKKADCRKRKADLNKGSGRGEHAHMARVTFTANALMDSGATW